MLPDSKNAYILNHEQKHFDIAFINTIRFIKNLRAASFTSTNYEALIGKIYNEAAEGMSKIQDQYDAETSHSRLPEEQARWDAEVSRQLAEALQEK